VKNEHVREYIRLCPILEGRFSKQVGKAVFLSDSVRLVFALHGFDVDSIKRIFHHEYIAYNAT
jgi:hypothetical protein